MFGVRCRPPSDSGDAPTKGDDQPWAVARTAPLAALSARTAGEALPRWASWITRSSGIAGRLAAMPDWRAWPFGTASGRFRKRLWEQTRSGQRLERSLDARGASQLLGVPVRPAGIEPAACGLKDRCSLAPRREPLTTELRARAAHDATTSLVWAICPSRARFATRTARRRTAAPGSELTRRACAQSARCRGKRR